MASIATLRVGIDATGAQRGARDAEGAMNRVQGSAERAAGRRGMGGLRRSMNDSRDAAGQLRATLGRLAAAMGATQVTRDAIGTMRNFEETMAAVQGVTNASEDEFEALASTAREFGASTRFSAQEAGEGLRFLAQAGFDSDQAMAALGPSLDLATVGQIQLGEAADHASNILGGFQMEAEHLGTVVDVMTSTSQNANTSVNQLAQAMSFVGAQAAAVGLDVEQTSAAIGVLGDVGIQGTRAGRGLRRALSQLLNPTESAAAAIEGLGLSVEELNPESNDLIDIFQRLEESGMSAADASEIFGDVGGQVALNLAANTDRLKELDELNRQSEGSAADFASTLDDTLDGSMRALRSSVEELFLSLGDEGVLGGFRELVEFTTDVVRALAGNDSVSEAAQDVAKWVEAIAVGVGAIVAVKLAAWAAGVAAALIPLAANPLAWIGAAAAALVMFRDEIVEFGDTTGRVMDWTVAIWRVTSRVYGETFSANMSTIMEIAHTVANGIVGAFVWLGDRIRLAFSKVFTVITEPFVALFETVLGGVDGIIGALNAIPGVDIDLGDLDEFKKSLRGLRNTVADIAEPSEEELESAFTRDYVGELIESVGEVDPLKAISDIAEAFGLGEIANEFGAAVVAEVEQIQGFRAAEQLRMEQEAERARQAEAAQEAQERLDEAQRAYNEAVEQGVGVEDARADLEEARLNRLAEMTGRERRVAREMRDRAEDELEAADEEMRALRDRQDQAERAIKREKQQHEEAVSELREQLDAQDNLIDARERAHARAIQQHKDLQEEIENLRRRNRELMDSVGEILDQPPWERDADELARLREEQDALHEQWDELEERIPRRAERIEQAEQRHREAMEEREAILDRLTEKEESLADQISEAQAPIREELEQINELLERQIELREELAQKSEEMGSGFIPSQEDMEQFFNGESQPGEQGSLPGGGADELHAAADAAVDYAEGLGFAAAESEGVRIATQDLREEMGVFEDLPPHIQDLNDRFTQTRNELSDTQAEAEETSLAMQTLEQAGQRAARMFADELVNVITNTKNAREAVEDLVQSISRMAVQMAVQGAMSAAFGGGFAQGAAFSGGRVVPFASGGVVDQPTTFPMSGGRTGLMGEAGPEAIMPLERGADGSLGVRANGGGGANVTINVQTPNAESFRKSTRQIAAEVASAIREAQ